MMSELRKKGREGGSPAEKRGAGAQAGARRGREWGVPGTREVALFVPSGGGLSSEAPDAPKAAGGVRWQVWHSEPRSDPPGWPRGRRELTPLCPSLHVCETGRVGRAAGVRVC